MPDRSTTRPAAGSLRDLRRRNRAQILDVVRERGTTSRAEIAKRTGLSTTTVSTLVAQLLDEAVVAELPEMAGVSAGGRPARVLAFNPAAGGTVGVHLAHDTARVAVADLTGAVVAESARALDVDHEPAATLTFVADEIARLVAAAGTTAHAVGVAVSAPVSPPSRGHLSRLDSSVILTDWRGVDLAGELGGRTGLPVVVGNDANLGALAEHRAGAARGVDDVVYVMLSDGIGAGMVLGGRLYEGASGGAGEIGHVTAVPGGFVCRCGNRGCLETVANAHALTSALTLTRGAGTTLAEVLAADVAGDDDARRVLADAGEAVGAALVPLCTLLDPALVVLGGACAASPRLVEAVGRTLAGGVTRLRRRPVPVRRGSLGDRAEVLGAIALAAREIGAPPGG